MTPSRGPGAPPGSVDKKARRELRRLVGRIQFLEDLCLKLYETLNSTEHAKKPPLSVFNCELNPVKFWSNVQPGPFEKAIDDPSTSPEEAARLEGYVHAVRQAISPDRPTFTHGMDGHEDEGDEQ